MADAPEILAPTELDALVETELGAIARRYRSANNLGMQGLALIGGQAENMLDRLPGVVRSRLEDVTKRALEIAMTAALASRRSLPDTPDWTNTAVTGAMGAAGGFGGLPSAMAELPVTTTMFLRAIQGIATEHGFDPTDDGVRMDCLQVFAAAGPLSSDDTVDLGFLSTRLALTGQTVRAVLQRVAPRLSIVLGQKLAAQTVPLLGALAGATTNVAFTSYYQNMARVQFGLRALARDTAIPYETLVHRLEARLQSA